MKKKKDLAISKWVKGKISTDEMSKILGKEETEKIVLLRKTLRESVLRGIKIGKQLRKSQIPPKLNKQ